MCANTLYLLYKYYMYNNTCLLNMKAKARAADIQKIVENFLISGEVETSGLNYGSGHINDTYCLYNKQPHEPNYLLQRINHHVFKDVSALTDNIYLVLNYLKKKMQLLQQRDLQVLELIPAKNKMLYHKDEDGNYWRMYVFIKDSKSFDIVETEQQAEEGGRAFGQFQALLSDMNASLLSETIVDFHNILFRLDNFNKALKENKANRAANVQEEIDFILARVTQMRRIYDMGQQGLLPKRITHNDTKFNNILFNQQDKAICVIDLDTVMPGYVAYDFGDAIRTIINTAAEDEADLSKIKLNIPLFEAYTKGYLAEAGKFLTANEVKSLLLGVFLLPYMQAVRFLTDYLEGDHYFKIAYPEHNLVRTKAQLHLLKQLEEHEAELQEIISTYSIYKLK